MFYINHKVTLDMLYYTYAILYIGRIIYKVYHTIVKGYPP